jgi:hypothetical protein
LVDRNDLQVAIRNGQNKQSEIEAVGKQFEAEAIEAQATSPLPNTVDSAAVSALITRFYLAFCNAAV